MARKRYRTKPKKPDAKRFIALYPQQKAFLLAQERIVGFCAGIGSGKTRTALTRIYLTAKDGESHLTVSPSYNMLRRATVVLAKQLATEIGILKKITMTPYPVLRFKTQDGGQAELIGASADKPDSIRGANLDSCHLDEASYMASDTFTVCIGRLRGIRGQMGNMLLTFTPRGRDWCFDTFYEMAEEPAGPNMAKSLGLIQVSGKWYAPREGTKLIRASSKDNPFISKEFYESLKGIYGTQLAEQELEAQFLDTAGTLFKREWFAGKMRDGAPRRARRVRYWDLAATEFDGCYTCGSLLAMMPNGEVYVENVIRGQWSTMIRNTMIKEVADQDARRYNNEVMQVFEQEPGSGGKEQANQMVRMLAGKPVYKDLPSHGQATRNSDGQKLPGSAKVYRSQPFCAQCEAGNVYIVRGEWNDEWLSEITGFPEMTICDQVDSTSAAYNYLAKGQTADPGDIITVSGTSRIPEKYGMPKNSRFELPTFVGRN